MRGWRNCRRSVSYTHLKEHLIKPEPEIYQLLLKRYGLKAEESVFLDDTLKNDDICYFLLRSGKGFDAITMAILCIVLMVIGMGERSRSFMTTTGIRITRSGRII